MRSYLTSLTSKKKTQRKTLYYYITKQSWCDVRIMLSDPACQKEITKQLAKVDFSGLTLLHQLCRMHPPLDVVERLNIFSASMIHRLDFLDRTPLHHAVGWGASPQVVEYLLRLNREAALWKDLCGKTPLHLALDESSDGWCDTGNEAGDIIVGPLISVVEVVCRAAPQAINIEDNSGKNPLEYAIDRAFDIRVINMMHRESQLDWKRQNGEELSPEDRKNIVGIGTIPHARTSRRPRRRRRK